MNKFPFFNSASWPSSSKTIWITLVIFSTFSACSPSNTKNSTEQIDEMAQNGDLEGIKAILRGDPSLIRSRAKDSDIYTPEQDDVRRV